MSAIFPTHRLFNKNVLITGASGGIGAATAILFAKAGANIIISARRPEKLSEVRQAAQQAHKEGGTGQGGKVFEWVQDVQDRRGVDKLFDLLPQDFKKIDVLVNNAGLVYGRDQVGEVNEQEMDIMFQTNVLGMIHLVSTFLIFVNDGLR
ncbi:hypothetical protein FFLO_07039 [Filobasidium floriforme]|uniref:NAD(P)-binding protein n=1 Tax=Filobasidium floriforme TaxID=5210 RepID=A0A8K0JDS0_9TREE|nr:hypothetical protein FFLO_07039 [Filobasidium floriforme]